MEKIKFNTENKGKYFMRFQYGCGTGIIINENSSYYFTNDGVIGKHNARIITEDEFNKLNDFYKSLSDSEFTYRDSISYMDGLKDLEFINQSHSIG